MGKPKKHSAFSVVMAVYKNDCVEWFRQAVDSILDQTVASNDIVIVRDGTVSPELEQALVEYEKIHKEITVARLEQNVGAGRARNEGVKYTKNSLVAIMDADDISLPNRFELQLEKFASNPELALVGGQISEFECDPSNITGYRRVPTEYEAIKKFARYRSPINNMTIMLRKDKFLAVGGYADMNRAEDYYMVSAMIAKAFLINNIPDTVVNYRVDSSNIHRRKSWSAVRENIVARWKIYRIGTSSLVGFLMSSAGQIVLLMLPNRATKLMFKLALRGNA